MKKFNSNIIVFIAVMIFIIWGFNNDYFTEIKVAVKGLCKSVYASKSDSISNFTGSIDSISTESLRYHDSLMNIDSLKKRISNTRIIEKEDTVLVKTDNDSLVEPQEYVLPDEWIHETVDAVYDLQKFSQQNSARFLYVAMTGKGYDAALPKNVKDYSEQNYDNFIEGMRSKDVCVLDLKNEFLVDGKLPEEIFFKTDHHWTPRVAFEATGIICQKLKSEYGFDYNTEYIDIKNYNIKMYNEWFLGSYGKKVGESYVGADDFDIITPKFETNLTEKQPIKNQIKTGSFEETVMDMNNVNRKDYYNLNSYAAYSGGDFRLQIIKNDLNPNGKKILIVRDSFACAVTPFLSLQTAELHIVDIRDREWYVGDKINVYDYIEEIKPNYVIVLYQYSAKLSDVAGRYNFK